MLGRTRESLGPSRHAATPARFCPDVSATQGKVFFKLVSLDGDYADWRDRILGTRSPTDKLDEQFTPVGDTVYQKGSLSRGGLKWSIAGTEKGQ